MTKREYLQWQVFDAMEPIGFLRDDYLAASIAQAAVMAHVKDPPTIAESILFAPDRFDEPDEEEAEEEHSVVAWKAAAKRIGLPVVEAEDEAKAGSEDQQ